MASLIDPLAGEVLEQATVVRAAEHGVRLVQSETDTGQVVWEWRHGPELRPQFVTRRVALHWMRDWLDGDRTRFHSIEDDWPQDGDASASKLEDRNWHIDQSDERRRPR